MCDRDLRHSLLKMSFISGEHSDKTFRHSEMRSTSSSVIGFLAREDLPRCSTVAMMSMASATKDWNRQQTLEEQPKNWFIFTQASGISRFASSYLERYQHNARPLWSVWWPRMLPRKNLHPSESLWVEVWINRSGDYWEFGYAVQVGRCTRKPLLPVLFLLRGSGGAESTLCHVSAHFCHQLLSWSCAHFILWFHLSRLFLYFIFHNRNLCKWDI